MAEKEIKIMADWMRRKSIDMAYLAGKNGAHLGPGLSAIEIIACLYGGVMNIDPQNPETKERDIFIPSKAHCVLAYYTALAYCGYFPIEALDDYEKDGSFLPGHPVMNVEKGIEISGGSLGMGVSQGVGLALAAKLSGQNKRIYVLTGDGECDEGSIWEGIMSAVHLNLNNLIIIVDQNKLQYDGPTSDIMNLGRLRDKLTAFGLSVYGANGHDISALLLAFQKMKEEHTERPKVLIADTIKGKGISFMENKKEWHHAILTKEQYETAKCELEG